MAVDIYGNVIMPEDDPGFYGPRPQPRTSGYGYPPYQEASLSTRQRVLAALSGLGAIRPGAGFGESFLQGLGGASRNVYLAQTQAQNAAQEYAQRQVEAERQKQRDEINRRFMEAQIKQMERPQKPEKPEGLVQVMGPNGPIYVRESDAVGKPVPTPKPAKEGREPLVQVAGPDGDPIYVPQSQAVGKKAPRGAEAAKPASGAEKTSLAYYNRMRSAEDTIQTLENKMAKLSLPQQYQLRYAPNIAQSADQQVYRQAQRAFTEARLRKESGAAIPQGEYDTDAQTYFAQPGDKPETVKKKRAARQAVLNGLKFSAGKAYDEFYGGGGDADLIYNPKTGELEPAR